MKMPMKWKCKNDDVYELNKIEAIIRKSMQKF